MKAGEERYGRSLEADTVRDFVYQLEEELFGIIDESPEVLLKLNEVMV